MKPYHLYSLMILIVSFAFTIMYCSHSKAVIEREKIQNDILEKEKDRALQREIMEFKKSHKP